MLQKYYVNVLFTMFYYHLRSFILDRVDFSFFTNINTKYIQNKCSVFIDYIVFFDQVRDPCLTSVSDNNWTSCFEISMSTQFPLGFSFIIATVWCVLYECIFPDPYAFSVNRCRSADIINYNIAVYNAIDRPMLLYIIYIIHTYDEYMIYGDWGF